jgi:hypothetical protein
MVRTYDYERTLVKLTRFRWHRDVEMGELQDNECRFFVEDSILTLVRSRPAYVFIASNVRVYRIEVVSVHRKRGHVVRGSGDGPGRSDSRGKSSLWTEGLSQTIERLTDAGIEVVVVNVVPNNDFDPRKCAVLRLIIDADSCAMSVDFDTADQEHQMEVRAELDAATRAGAKALDVADELCLNGTCASRLDGVWVWKDSGNLSVDAAVILIPEFSALLKPLDLRGRNSNDRRT